MPVELTRPFATRVATATILIGAMAAAGCASAPWKSSREEVLQQILPSAVQIVVERREGSRLTSGSGVAIGSRKTATGAACFVLTAGHTVAAYAGKAEIYAVFGRHLGTGRKARASLVASRNDTIDLALLRTEADQCAPVRSARPPALGEPIWVVGFPLGRHIMLSSGIVSQVIWDGVNDSSAPGRLMVDAPVNYGVSGGGVFDARTGGLIGVVEGFSTARVTPQGSTPAWYIDVPVPGQTHVTPLADIRTFLSDFEQADLLRPGERWP
jgi:S1-C subfamily serine protease